MKALHRFAAFTIIEVLVAAVVAGVVIAGAVGGVIALQRSFIGNKQYATGMNNGSRVLDYISRDLRNALRVSRLSGSTPVAFKSGTFEIAGADQFVIHVPDFYLSNTTDNSSGSSFKTPRYSRSNLPSGQTWFLYDDAVAIVGVTRLPRYPGEVEVRYVKKRRSTQDPTFCYFRQEYDGGSIPVLRSEHEIAERVADTQITVLALDKNRFRLLSSFAPRWTGEAARIGTRQFLTVTLLNKRRD